MEGGREEWLALPATSVHASRWRTWESKCSHVTGVCEHGESWSRRTAAGRRPQTCDKYDSDIRTQRASRSNRFIRDLAALVRATSSTSVADMTTVVAGSSTSTSSTSNTITINSTSNTSSAETVLRIAPRCKPRTVNTYQGTTYVVATPLRVASLDRWP